MITFNINKMKNITLIVLSILSATALLPSCTKDYLEKLPLGVASESTLSNKKGVNAVLIGAYSLLDAVGADRR